jgi:hypothetical protein
MGPKESGPNLDPIGIFSVTFELSRKGTTNERQVYDVLSLLGDVGGFKDALFLISEILVSLVGGCLFRKTLVESTFKARKPSIPPYQSSFWIYNSESPITQDPGEKLKEKLAKLKKVTLVKDDLIYLVNSHVKI